MEVDFESLAKQLSTRLSYELVFVQMKPLRTQNLKPYTGLTQRLYSEVFIGEAQSKFTNEGTIYWLALDMIMQFKNNRRVRTPMFNCFYNILQRQWIIENVEY